MLRTLAADDIAGIRALLVHAKSTEAAGFTRRHGFLDSPLGDLTLMLPLSEAALDVVARPEPVRSVTAI